MKNTKFKILFIFTLLLPGCFLSCTNKQENTKQVEENETPAIERTLDKADEVKKNILFFGNSLTAGLGLKEEESFPFLIQQRIDSLKLDYSVINAGLSGETTAGGNSRIDWVLNQPIDVFVLELGGNDILRGISLQNTEDNLRSIIKKVQTKYPNIPILIAGMQAPPNMGLQYAKAFGEIYSTLATEFDTGYIPFLLEGVGGIPELNLGDGIHPNAEGQKIVRDNIWKVLKDYL